MGKGLGGTVSEGKRPTIFKQWNDVIRSVSWVENYGGTRWIQVR